MSELISDVSSESFPSYGKWIARRPIQTLPGVTPVKPIQQHVDSPNRQLVSAIFGYLRYIKNFFSQLLFLFRSRLAHSKARFPYLGGAIFCGCTIFASLTCLGAICAESLQIWRLCSVTNNYPFITHVRYDTNVSHMIERAYQITIIAVIFYSTILPQILLGLLARNVYIMNAVPARSVWTRIAFLIPPITIIGVPLLMFDYSNVLKNKNLQKKDVIHQHKKLRRWMYSWFGIHILALGEIIANCIVHDEINIVIFKEVTIVFYFLLALEIIYTYLVIRALAIVDQRTF